MAASAPWAFAAPATVSAQEVQWAASVINYSSQLEYDSYSASQALGAPNSMPNKGYSATAWTASGDERREFLHVGFERPMRIRQVIVAENHYPGAIVRIILYDTGGNKHTIYKQPADTIQAPSRFLHVPVDETPYRVAAVRVDIDCRLVPGINQVDAIGIAAHTAEVQAEVKVATGMSFAGKPEKLGPEVNTKYTEVGPIIAPDGLTLFVSRKDYPPNHDDDEVWFSRLDTAGRWTTLVNAGSPLNNKHHNFVSSITPDGNTVLVNGIYFEDPEAWGNGFSFSAREAGGWGWPEKAEVENYVNTDRYINFYLTNDGLKVFMNVRRADTRGESDLYVSFARPGSSWSEPVNLGPDVNTTGRECCAFLAADNTTLYFSSDGYNGFGSNDIYMTRRKDSTWTRWSEPLNLGPPVNTGSWDAYWTIPARGDFAYFVKDGDIYRIRISPEVSPNPVVLVYGKVFDRKTEKPVGGALITYEHLETGAGAGVARSSPDSGEYKIVLPRGHAYGFLASAAGYLSQSDHLDVTELKKYRELERDLYLVPAEVGETIRLNNVFFDFGKSVLRDESIPELKRVLRFLESNPQAEISLGGHTDHVGDDQANLQLSQARVDAVRAFLTGHGIDPDRLEARGYGESVPVAGNETEEGRALNRRVDFTIVKR